jgi:hypothetical protein
MKRIQMWRWLPVAVLLAMGGTTERTENLVIQSFDGAGGRGQAAESGVATRDTRHTTRDTRNGDWI